MQFDSLDLTEIRLSSLGQLTKGGQWQLDLVHDRGEHLLLWITRGQGLALLDGARVGIGAHNAIFVPARQLMAIDLGRQGFGQALMWPGSGTTTLPRTIQHLRIRDVAAQAELTMLLENLGREQASDRPLRESAVGAWAELAALWLRRQAVQDAAPAASPARRLTRAYFARLVTHFATGQTMAEHAAALDVTPTHLTRVCRAETGRTAATLLTERQLHAARMLLGTTDMAIQDIAQRLGFGSAAYFTRFIQHHTGQTPSALRRAPATSAGVGTGRR